MTDANNTFMSLKIVMLNVLGFTPKEKYTHLHIITRKLIANKHRLSKSALEELVAAGEALPPEVEEVVEMELLQWAAEAAEAKELE
ncbi:hypothetical protein N0V85_009615 [Neurospora sp. IMI 360204]|nr:hypothetical protein N0V85_009615 [Neurospora sp. IMI 360204]